VTRSLIETAGLEAQFRSGSTVQNSIELGSSKPEMAWGRAR